MAGRAALCRARLCRAGRVLRMVKFRAEASQGGELFERGLRLAETFGLMANPAQGASRRRKLRLMTTDAVFVLGEFRLQ